MIIHKKDNLALISRKLRLGEDTKNSEKETTTSLT